MPGKGGGGGGGGDYKKEDELSCVALAPYLTRSRPGWGPPLSRGKKLGGSLSQASTHPPQPRPHPPVQQEAPPRGTQASRRAGPVGGGHQQLGRQWEAGVPADSSAPTAPQD